MGFAVVARTALSPSVFGGLRIDKKGGIVHGPASTYQ